MAECDGGPAFPIPDVYAPDGNGTQGCAGMTLRDYFAIHAPEPSPNEAARAFDVIERPGTSPTSDPSYADWLQRVHPARYRIGATAARYAYADAMLKARLGRVDDLPVEGK